MRSTAVFVSIVLLSMVLPGAAIAQGQDSTRHERDMQVIQAMLPGLYANANQSYFDARGNRPVVHASLTIAVEVVETDIAPTFMATITRGDDTRFERWTLMGDDTERAVRMRSFRLRSKSDAQDGGDGQYCDVLWRREAAQFRAAADGGCPSGFATDYVLSEPQLWVADAREAGADFELHRARTFECYADIPGVGGGRDEPFERYGPFPVHDQGGSVWFDAKDGRRLGLSLFLVDWPINNYTGIFTRDSLVVYVNEQLETERKQHGYAFTLPEADRIGINLKWLLANCYMESNEVATPYM